MPKYLALLVGKRERRQSRPQSRLLKDDTEHMTNTKRCFGVNERDKLAVIQPFSYDDPETGDHIEVSVSPYYSKIIVNSREYYFIRETGEFDGTSTARRTGPILAYDAG